MPQSADFKTQLHSALLAAGKRCPTGFRLTDIAYHLGIEYLHDGPAQRRLRSALRTMTKFPSNAQLLAAMDAPSNGIEDGLLGHSCPPMIQATGGGSYILINPDAQTLPAQVYNCARMRGGVFTNGEIVKDCGLSASAGKRAVSRILSASPHLYAPPSMWWSPGYGKHWRLTPGLMAALPVPGRHLMLMLKLELSSQGPLRLGLLPEAFDNRVKLIGHTLAALQMQLGLLDDQMVSGAVGALLSESLSGSPILQNTKLGNLALREWWGQFSAADLSGALVYAWRKLVSAGQPRIALGLTVAFWDGLGEATGYDGASLSRGIGKRRAAEAS